MPEIETNNPEETNVPLIETENDVDTGAEQEAEQKESKGKRIRTKIKNFFVRLGIKIKNFFTYNIEGKRPRAWELDLIRGIIIVGVIFDHVCRFSHFLHLFNFKTAFGQAIGAAAVTYINSKFCVYFYPFVLWLLCFMSGISCQFARSTMKRLLKFWIVCAVVMGGYLVLHFIFPEQMPGYILFNIIAVLTLSASFWYVLDKLKIPDIYRLILGALIAVAGVTLFFVYKFGPNGVNVTNDFFALFVYNKHGYQVSKNNFEPLMPHIGFFILGGVFGKHVYADKATKLKRKTPPKWLSPIMILGKHSFVAYFAMPVLCIGVLWLIVSFIGLLL